MSSRGNVIEGDYNFNLLDEVRLFLNSDFREHFRMSGTNFTFQL